ncbi:MAG: hypothetical protein VX528_16300, partial [Candidatus Latescibacterota bacterium]|nr:hypothetical protein [Candidatus Latescibacterota bacterium]
MSPRRSITAVVERNVTWEGDVTTEPWEAGWASEGVFFIRVLESTSAHTSTSSEPTLLRVQLSPDGMH